VGTITAAAAGQQAVTTTVILTVTNNTNLFNEPPVVDAGVPQTFTLTPNQLPVTVHLSGGATDDGLPTPPGRLEYTWTIYQADNMTAVNLTNVNSQNTSVVISEFGLYMFQLYANDGADISDALVTVIIDQVGNMAPVIHNWTASAMTVKLGERVQLSVVATDDGLPNPPAKLLYFWDRVQTGVGIADFATPNEATTMVTFSEVSSYLCQVTVDDGVKTAVEKHTIVVVAADGTSTVSEPVTIQTASEGGAGVGSTSVDISCEGTSESASATATRPVEPVTTTGVAGQKTSSGIALSVSCLFAIILFLL